MGAEATRPPGEKVRPSEAQRGAGATLPGSPSRGAASRPRPHRDRTPTRCGAPRRPPPGCTAAPAVCPRQTPCPRRCLRFPSGAAEPLGSPWPAWVKRVGFGTLRRRRARRHSFGWQTVSAEGQKTLTCADKTKLQRYGTDWGKSLSRKKIEPETLLSPA